MRYLILGFAVSVIALAVSPASARMSASVFLGRADNLVARRPFALLSPALKVLQAEAEAAGDELHAEHAAKLIAHEPTDWCAPASTYLKPRELIRGLHRFSPGELERMDIKQAMRAVLARNYPCPH